MCRYSLPQSPEPCVAFRPRAGREDGDRQETKGLSTTCRVDFGFIEEVLYSFTFTSNISSNFLLIFARLQLTL